MSKTHIDPPSPAPRLEAYKIPKGGGANAGSYDVEVHPGFGCVTLCRDGVEYRRDEKGERALTWYESLIRKSALPHEPTPVWTIHIDGPFCSLLYALTPTQGWALIDTKDGFA